MVKPSEWTVSKVAEFNAAGSDIKVRVRSRALSLFVCFPSRFWTRIVFVNLNGDAEFTSAGIEARSGNAARDVGHGDHSQDRRERDCRTEGYELD